MNENEVENTVLERELAPLDKKQVRKKLFFLGFIVLVILAGLIAVTAKLYTPPTVVEGCQPGDSFSQTTGKPCKEIKVEACVEGELYNSTNGEPCVGVEYINAVPGENFAALLKSYAGRSFLLDANCLSTPKLLNVSLNTRILTVNNSKKVIEVDILGENIILEPYRSLVSYVTTAGLFPLTCNGGVSASLIVK